MWQWHTTLYNGLATFTGVTFVNVHHVQMSTFVCLWYISFVTISTTKINRKYRLWYNVSVPYPKPGLAENTRNVELGAVPLFQHFSVFSAWPGLGYGTLIHCTTLHCTTQHRTTLFTPSVANMIKSQLGSRRCCSIWGTGEITWNIQRHWTKLKGRGPFT